ncbi:hypothetical protein EB796_003709 [Bugula neritina]|uniref:RIH domain-containing protein n=1 Tax=Bugula neritina TaxID=10212 RepID=A0A7J7KJC9_BUGNE|nr:hypothetical protein EB796_003709 [Bugula neritina]
MSFWVSHSVTMSCPVSHDVTMPCPVSHDVTMPCPVSHDVTMPCPVSHDVTMPCWVSHDVTMSCPVSHRVTMPCWVSQGVLLHALCTPGTEASRKLSNKEDAIVMDTKLKIIQILQFILDVRLDYRISCLLSIFKREFDETVTQSDPSGLDLNNIQSQAEDIFEGSELQNDLDLDGQGGRMFLRVLLNLVMHNYPSLVSGALKLLFRHFSQRQEVLNAFKQVQLLISANDVENYKQIKADLDDLRNIVEKSELWVYKERAEDDSSELEKKKDKSKDTRRHPHLMRHNSSAIDLDIGPRIEMNSNRNYKTIKVVLQRLTNLCATKAAKGQVVRPKKHEQRLLRNMGAHLIVLELLQIPYEKKKDIRMHELMKLAHEFLQCFCLGNKNNQSLLHKSLELFLTPSLWDAQTARAIFSTIRLCVTK